MTRALAIAALLAACGGDADETPDAGSQWCPDLCPSSDNQYVADSQELTATALLDIDGDGAPENRLGSLLVTSTDARVDLPGSVQRGVLRGETINLLHLRASGLTTAAHAGLWLFLGTNPYPAPCVSADDPICGHHLDGLGTFDIALDSPTDAMLVGDIVGGRLRAGPGILEFRLWFGAGDPIPILLLGARVDAAVSDTAIMEGRLAGGIHQQVFEQQVIPAVRDYIDAAVARDCPAASPPCCTPGTPGEAWMDSLDFDGDCALDTDVVTGLEGPDIYDLDLIDADGTYNPNTDGTKDSISFGIRFTAVPAAFAGPPQ